MEIRLTGKEIDKLVKDWPIGHEGGIRMGAEAQLRKDIDLIESLPPIQKAEAVFGVAYDGENFTRGYFVSVEVLRAMKEELK